MPFTWNKHVKKTKTHFTDMPTMLSAVSQQPDNQHLQKQGWQWQLPYVSQDRFAAKEVKGF